MKEKISTKKYTHKEWIGEGRRLFGTDIKQWKFVCPSCGIVISIADYIKAGAPDNTWGFNCIGRYTPEGMATDIFSGKQPCNYTSGGLICVSPVEVSFPDGKTISVFDFARPLNEEKENRD